MSIECQSGPGGAKLFALGGFTEGSEVLTLSGIKSVEALSPGDRVVTRGGTRVLRSVTHRRVENPELVRVSASALGHDRPEADIVIAADQPILLRDWRARALAGEDRALVAAGRLADGEYIRHEACSEARLYTLHFDGPAVIYAQGLELACATVAVPA
jgi:Hint domain